MLVLGIEASCDETAAAVIEGLDKVETRHGASLRVLSSVVSSQIEIHKKYGGVVPEVAAREHVLNILPVVNEALALAGMRTHTEENLTPRPHPSPLLGKERGRKRGDMIDAIAVTVGPGLITSLQVGVETAKTLAYAWDVPTIAVNHLEAHIYSNFIGREKILFPAIILTVSGGHTALVLMKGHGRYQLLGETRDDAAGEAFDKAAQLLKLGYPGGPAIAAEAAKIRKATPLTPLVRGAATIQLPRPMIESDNFDFSFSGLKTALFYSLKKDKDWKKKVSEYAAEFQQAVVEVLVVKTIRAARQFGVKTVMLAGGVAANRELRRELEVAVKKSGFKFFMPDLKYTTDNAAMVAAAGYFKARRKEYTPWRKLKTDANLELNLIEN